MHYDYYMLKLYILALTLLTSSIIIFGLSLNKLAHKEENEIREHYNLFKSKYHKHYLTNAENDLRFQLFANAYKFIHDHNSKPFESFKLAINQFADLTDEEF